MTLTFTGSLVLLGTGLFIGLFNLKGRTIYALAVVFVMTMLFAFRLPEESDTEAYYSLYELLQNREPGQLVLTYGVDRFFLAILRFFAKTGLSFEGFRAILFLLSMGLILSTVRKLTGNLSLFLCIYFIFPFGYDIDQIRQLLATAIIVFGLRYLLFTKKSVPKYVLCVAAAALAHMSAAVYIVYLLIYIKKDILYAVCAAAGAVLFWASMLTNWDWIGSIGRLTGIEKITWYSRSISTYKMSLLFGLFEFLFAYAFLALSQLLYVQRGRRVTLDNFDEQYFEPDETERNIRKLCCISMIAMPFIAYSLTFERLLRPMIIIYYGLICGRVYEKTTANRILMSLALLVILALRTSISLPYLTKIFTNCTLF